MDGNTEWRFQNTCGEGAKKFNLQLKKTDRANIEFFYEKGNRKTIPFDCSDNSYGYETCTFIVGKVADWNTKGFAQED